MLSRKVTADRLHSAESAAEASRETGRLPSITPGRLGGRAFGSRMETDYEPEEYRVTLPDPQVADS